MDSLDFIVDLIRTHQAVFLFPATMVEGPIVTIIASSLAAHGVLPWGVVFLVALAGDFAGDLLYYSLGRFGRRNLIDTYGRYVGIRADHLVRAEAYVAENFSKAVVAAKISHVVGLAILFGVGMLRMNVLKFSAVSLAVGVPKTAAFVAVGYFFGESYKIINQYLHWGASVVVFFVSFFILYKAFQYFRWKAKIYGTS